MRPLFLIAFTATLVTAESVPDWWAYTSPETTSLIGIRWDNLRHTPLSSIVDSALAPNGPLGFPDLNCLREAREIVISSPALLIVLTGNFPVATVADQAAHSGLRSTVHRGVTLWLPEFAERLGVFQVSDQLVLVGTQPTLRAAIDAEFSERGGRSSQLLSRGTHFFQTADFWAVGQTFPDPLVKLFVPVDAKGRDFLGQGSVSDGVAIKASFDAGTEQVAAEVVNALKEWASSFPTLAQGLDTTADRSRVAISLQGSLDDLVSAIRPHPAAHPPPTLAQAQTAADSQPTFTFEVTHLESAQPRIIRIFNLEEGTREITLPLDQPAVQVVGAEH